MQSAMNPPLFAILPTCVIPILLHLLVPHSSLNLSKTLLKLYKYVIELHLYLYISIKKNYFSLINTFVCLYIYI